MSEIIIREAVADDWQEVKRLNKMLFDYDSKNVDLNMDWPDQNDTYYQSVMTADDHFVQVAEVGGEMVGYMITKLRNPMSFRAKPNQAEIDNVFIIEQYRQHGIGHQFVAKAKEWALTKGMPILRVATLASNAIGKNFYQKEGFESYLITYEMPIA